MMRWQRSGEFCISPSMVFPRRPSSFLIGARKAPPASARLYPPAAGLAWPALQGYRRAAAAQPENLRLVLAAQPKRAREKRAILWAVAPVVARSARISPITGANLNP